jgi:hypothetical protein
MSHFLASRCGRTNFGHLLRCSSLTYLKVRSAPRAWNLNLNSLRSTGFGWNPTLLGRPKGFDSSNGMGYGISVILYPGIFFEEGKSASLFDY